MISVWMDSWTNGPGTNPHFYETWKITPNFRSLKQQVIGNVGNVLWVVMATVGLVMLIACTNVANLLLVRADARQQELVDPGRVGSGASADCARTAGRERDAGADGRGTCSRRGLCRTAAAGRRWGRPNLPRLSEISLDARSLGFTFALSVLSGLLFGSIPALEVCASASLGDDVREPAARRAQA